MGEFVMSLKLRKMAVRITVNSNFRIEIEAVADITTWDDTSSTYQYQVNEDEDNVTLQFECTVAR
ncbi:hypothetical protein O9929_20725 [Vibrio lentus]|nr:hypothetical protein [Vibrio lentus]